MSEHPSHTRVAGQTQRVTDQFQPEIRARYQCLTIYELEESELQMLEYGSLNSGTWRGFSGYENEVVAYHVRRMYEG